VHGQTGLPSGRASLLGIGILMAIDRSTLMVGKAPYWFAAAVSVMLLQFIWLSPVPSLIAIGAISGSVVFLIQCLASRIGRDAVSVLSMVIMLAPCLHVASKLPNWSIVMYASVFFVVVTGFHTLLFGIERVRRR